MLPLFVWDFFKMLPLGLNKKQRWKCKKCMWRNRWDAYIPITLAQSNGFMSTCAHKFYQWNFHELLALATIVHEKSEKHLMEWRLVSHSMGTMRKEICDVSKIIIILCNIMFCIAYWFFLIHRCIYDRLNHIKTLYTFVYKRVYIYNIVQTNDIEASISTTNGIKSQGIDFWKTLRRMENTEKIAKRILVKNGGIHLSLELMRRACTLLSKISVVLSIYTY